ncbi:MAG TPA: DUF4382 domain-containing protein [Gemmatimonadaceae bacterium]|nr:DUF4382 domain-containing protein [Gemmatimonadaceae bacterium]
MRTKLFRSILAACAFAAATACSDSSGNSGTLSVRLTDAPFPFSEVERVDIFVVRVDARRTEPSETDAENDEDMSEWVTIGSPGKVINLLDLAGGVTTNLGEATIPTGIYSGFRLVIDPAQSGVTLKDGSEPDVKWPSAAQSGIKVKLDAPVEVDEDGSVLVLDFDVGRSFVLRGNSIRNNGLLFKPVVRGTAVDITGGASGVVRGDDANGPLVAGATVEVLKPGTLVTETSPDSVVATTSSDANGAFAFSFLMPGAYVLRATPPSESVYKPALLAGGLTIVRETETPDLLIILPR